jgi:hypothetical protein|tara:strand:+ start:178 stop:288 length:111 start_codon:yes stop_codon:yes gene_type:complete
LLLQDKAPCVAQSACGDCISFGVTAAAEQAAAEQVF